MDLGTALGLLLGVGFIAAGIVSNHGDLRWFLDFDAILIVLGGTFAATLVNYPVKNVLGIFKILTQAFRREDVGHQGVIDQLVEKAEKGRKKGIMSLETDLDGISDHFLRGGLELAINERDPVRLRNYLELELSNMERRHSLGQEIFLYMGAYSPAFGLLGTVLGLIIMMTHFSSTENVGIAGIEFDVAKRFAELLGGMGLALITTFYGILLSNLVFLPLAGKLKRKSEEELMLKDILVEGIIGIHAKEHPILLREKLMTFVPQSKRTEET
ncbi:MAG: MotA/TolQ/ExbB proton channel family protein [Candidatus Neomarinimicrobiota bacterium]